LFAILVGLVSLQLGQLDASTCAMTTLLVVASAVYWQLAAFWEERFKAARGTSLALYAATCVSLICCAYLRDASAQHRWANAALSAFELMLCANLALWLCEGALLLGTIAMFARVLFRSEGPSVRRVLVTARLALFTSVGVLLAMLMVGFALLDRAVAPLVATLPYQPIYFGDPAHGSCCVATTAAAFLDDRTLASGASLPALALVPLSLLAFAALAFAPSVLREVRVLDGLDARRLGAWLTKGYRAIESLVRWWGLPAFLIAVGVIFLLSLQQLARLAQLDLAAPSWAGVVQFKDFFVATARSWLKVIVAVVAVNSLSLVALGKLTISNLKRLRAPLDAALDVDNHFREFPRHAISRVLIIERYMALLDHLSDEKYQRLVIVAHSQGTVITADLLRYLRQRSDDDPRVLKILRWLQTAQVSLLTVGSPLRQLYELRFPRTYDWVTRQLDDAGQTWCGPDPRELGVARWWNLWASGDYVGRWLWSSPASEPGIFDVEPARYDSDVVLHHSAYQWLDRCVGADAHTHYFDLDQRAVASYLSQLVTEAADAVPPRANAAV
jgi:hypothetical protein